MEQRTAWTKPWDGHAPEELERLLWQQLSENSSEHPSYFRWISLGYLAHPDQPTLKTVVLRSADVAGRTLRFFTDFRTPKVAALKQHRCGALFLSQDNRLQASFHADAKVHAPGSPTAQQAFASLSGEQLLDYATRSAPGVQATCLKTADQRDASVARQHFCVVDLIPRTLDLVVLNDQAIRLNGSYDPQTRRFQGQWLVP